MTSLITILAGVSVFVISQYFLRLVLDPITRVRRAVADVSSTVLFRQARISNATHDNDVAEELRRVSSQLHGSISEVRGYPFWFVLALFGIPSKSDARNGCRCLNLMAGNASSPDKDRHQLVEWNAKALDDLARFLNIETRY